MICGANKACSAAANQFARHRPTKNPPFERVT
jgi:hypothetical protein